MWMVFKDYDGYECETKTFPTEEKARAYFEEAKEWTSAQMYLAKVVDSYKA